MYKKDFLPATFVKTLEEYQKNYKIYFYFLVYGKNDLGFEKKITLPFPKGFS